MKFSFGSKRKLWVLKKRVGGRGFPGGPVIKTCTAKREDLISDQGTKVPKKRKKKTGVGARLRVGLSAVQIKMSAL